MTSTTNEKINVFRTLEKENKEEYIKFYIKEFTRCYNIYKTMLKDKSIKDESKTKNIDYNTLKMKIYMSQVLLFNSILKNNKENIIKNFNNYNELQLECMEMIEEISNDEKCGGFKRFKGSEIVVINIIKSEEQYRICCKEIKERYELLKYIIEDYNNIKL
jgi:hypothetical protein